MPFIRSKNHKVETKFLGWECVSVKLEIRTIDFIIKDPDKMMDFILAMNIATSIRSKTSLTRKNS